MKPIEKDYEKQYSTNVEKTNSIFMEKHYSRKSHGAYFEILTNQAHIEYH